MRCSREFKLKLVGFSWHGREDEDDGDDDADALSLYFPPVIMFSQLPVLSLGQFNRDHCNFGEWKLGQKILLPSSRIKMRMLHSTAFRVLSSLKKMWRFCKENNEICFACLKTYFKLQLLKMAFEKNSRKLQLINQYLGTVFDYPKILVWRSIRLILTTISYKYEYIL